MKHPWPELAGECQDLFRGVVCVTHFSFLRKIHLKCFCALLIRYG